MNIVALFTNLVVQEICELPNRTAPTDQPDMMLVTAAELGEILRRHLPVVVPPEAPPNPIAVELKRLNDNLEAGTLNLRTHHPLCVTPKSGDYTVQQLDAMGKFLNTAIDSGAFVLPQRGAE